MTIDEDYSHFDVLQKLKLKIQLKQVQIYYRFKLIKALLFNKFNIFYSTHIFMINFTSSPENT